MNKASQLEAKILSIILIGGAVFDGVSTREITKLAKTTPRTAAYAIVELSKRGLIVISEETNRWLPAA